MDQTPNIMDAPVPENLPSVAPVPSAQSGHKRKDSLASLISSVSNAVKLPLLNVSTTSLASVASSTLSSAGPVADPVGMFQVEVSNDAEDYEILHPIGYGSSAIVYAALYKPLDKMVAIKMIDLDMFERNQIEEIRRELQIMTLSKHKNLLPVYAAFVTRAKLYIVTPYLAAGSCLNILKSQFSEGLDEQSIAMILHDCLEGLDYLHKHGHIHRDIKAGNLLMDESGTTFLADFGVSSSLMDGGERKNKRKTFVGTPCWMAPEMLTPEMGYDYKADMWSFGITAIELATGRAPYANYAPLKVLMLTLKRDPPTLDRSKTKNKFSKTFAQMIDLCLQKDPSKRPTADELLKHAFFKVTKKRDHVIKNILQDLPPLTAKPNPNHQLSDAHSSGRVQSWDFGKEDLDELETPDISFDETAGDIITESTEMYNTISKELQESLPAIVEHNSEEDMISDTETIRRGRFNVQRLGVSDEEDILDLESIPERKGRFSVTPMGSMGSESTVSDKRHSRTTVSSSNSMEYYGTMTKDQLRGLLDKSIKYRTLLANGQLDMYLYP